MVIRRVGWLPALSFSVLLVLSACGASGQGGGPSAGAQQKPGGPPPAPVDAQAITRGPIAAGLSFTGDVTALQQVNLAPKISGIITKLMADVGSQVKAGQQVAELDHAGLDASVTQAKASVEVAQANQNKVRSQGRAEDITKAQSTLDSAKAQLAQIQNTSSLQAALDASKAKLAALQNGPRPEQVIIYQKAIDVAKNSLFAAQAKRDGDCRIAGPTCTADQAAVDAAQTALDQANAQYQLNIAPPTSTDVAQAVDAVRQAQAAVDNSVLQIQAQQAAVTSAQAALNEAKQPYLPTDLQSAQAQVDSAQAQLSAAQVNQQQAFVYAPFDGVISAKLLSEGALASPQTPIFTIVSTGVEIDLPVAQEQLGQIKEGVHTQLTTPAYPGQTFDGKIALVAPAADPKSRTFLVHVVPATQDGKLKPGMSAAVLIDTVQKNDALLVPRDAIVVDANGKSGVYVVQSGPNGTVAVFKPITTGVSDDKNTEVVSGLNPGDQIIVQGQAALNNNQRIRLSGGTGGPSPAASGGQSGGSQSRGAPSASARASGVPSSGSASAAPGGAG